MRISEELRRAMLERARVDRSARLQGCSRRSARWNLPRRRCPCAARALLASARARGRIVRVARMIAEVKDSECISERQVADGATLSLTSFRET